MDRLAPPSSTVRSPIVALAELPPAIPPRYADITVSVGAGAYLMYSSIPAQWISSRAGGSPRQGVGGQRSSQLALHNGVTAFLQAQLPLRAPPLSLPFISHLNLHFFTSLIEPPSSSHPSHYHLSRPSHNSSSHPQRLSALPPAKARTSSEDTFLPPPSHSLASFSAPSTSVYSTTLLLLDVRSAASNTSSRALASTTRLKWYCATF